MNRNFGFSLVELMITLAIVAIVASIALPTYQDQIRKSRRADGTTLLTEIRDLQERFFMENNTYTTALSGLGYTGSVKSDEEYYQVQVENPAGCGIANCFRLLASPILEIQEEDGGLRLWSDGTRERKVGGVWQTGWD
ncbi:MAG: type IV pilin protein [Gammaproteobacteria bacterium]